MGKVLGGGRKEHQAALKVWAPNLNKNTKKQSNEANKPRLSSILVIPTSKPQLCAACLSFPVCRRGRTLAVLPGKSKAVSGQLPPRWLALLQPAVPSAINTNLLLH